MPEEVPPAAATLEVTPVPATVPTPAPKAKAVEPIDPPYMQPRLARERRKVLKQLGIEVPKNATDLEIDKAIDEFKTKANTNKDRRKAAELDAAKEKDRADTLEKQTASIKLYAETELAALPEAQREIVKRLAGDDPSKQLEQIAVVKQLAPKALDASAVPAAAAPIPAPANTTPAAPAPTATQAVPVNLTEEWRRLQKQNPLVAAQFLLDNRLAIVPQPQ